MHRQNNNNIISNGLIYSLWLRASAQKKTSEKFIKFTHMLSFNFLTSQLPPQNHVGKIILMYFAFCILHFSFPRQRRSSHILFLSFSTVTMILSECMVWLWHNKSNNLLLYILRIKLHLKCCFVVFDLRSQNRCDRKIRTA